ASCEQWTRNSVALAAAARLRSVVVYRGMSSRTEPSSPSAPCPSYFTRFARGTASAMGRPAAFLFAFVLIIAWALTGPMFHFSDTWQLVINTSTTIVTFLMVF